MRKKIVALLLTGICWGTPVLAEDWAGVPLTVVENAASQGNADAQFQLGVMYLDGNGVIQDSYQAADWFRKSAEQGDSRALKKLRNAAEQEDQRAQYNLGMMYLNGKGVAQDYSQAVVWFKKMVDLGNYTEGVAGVRKAAELGSARAQDTLGMMYGNGQGVTLDFVQAVQWFRKAAEQGDSNAQCHLGISYEKGFGVTQDYSQAVDWYMKAAEQGAQYGQYRIGKMYAKGIGVNQDYSKAADWYTKSAKQGSYWAQDELSMMYSKGLGVTQDNKQAYVWSSVATTNWNANEDTKGYADVVKNRDTFAEKLTPTELNEAQKMAAEYARMYQPKK